MDDSGVARGMLAAWVSAFADLVGTYADGEALLADLDRADPEVVVLDLDMPGLGGLATLDALRARAHPARVILVSGGSLPVGRRVGADLLNKPRAADGAAGLGALRAALSARLEGPEPAAQDACPPPSRDRPLRGPAASIRAILIGASSGGPAAAERFVACLAPRLGEVALVIAQHLPAAFADDFARRIASAAGRTARVAADGAVLRPGTVFVASGDAHVLVTGPVDRPRLAVVAATPAETWRPSIDRLFASAAEVLGPAAAGVVLTGMGRDGLEGARALRAAGGRVFAQDEATSAAPGMPGTVAAAGLAEFVGSPADLAARLLPSRGLAA